MGDEMLNVFYSGDIFGSTGSLTDSTIKAFNTGWSDCTEFHLFRDYFGLIHLVQNTALCGDEEANEYGKFYKFTYNRTRGDSVGSDRDSISSSGSSSECPEFDVKLNGAFSSKAVGSSLTLGANRSLSSLKRTSIDTAARNRKNRENKKNRNANVCVFCRNNGETKKVYSSHVLKDAEGNTTCPILRAYTCPLCKASGNESHTIKYCPRNKNGSKLQAKV